jgi:hypothetical protein
MMTMLSCGMRTMEGTRVLKWTEYWSKWTEYWLKWTEYWLKWTEYWLKWTEYWLKWMEYWLKWTEFVHCRGVCQAGSNFNDLGSGKSLLWFVQRGDVLTLWLWSVAKLVHLYLAS